MENEKICSICGAVITDDDYEVIDDEILCRECFEDNYVLCDECDEYVPIENAVYIEYLDKVVCEDCLDDNFTQCAECGEYIANYDIIYVECDDRYVCQSCFDDNYGYCECCEEIFRLDDLHYSDDDDRYYCSDCYDENCVIAEYHSDKDIEFFGDDDSLYMGFELEVDDGNDIKTTVEYSRNLFPNNFMFFEHDGSLSSNGYENISQPCTLGYHLGNKEKYDDMFRNLVHYGFRSHNASHSCGLHIHINKDFFESNEDLGITRLLYMVEKFWDNLVKFSRRTEQQLNNWACRYNDSAENILEQYKRHNLSRYYALNLTNYETIEFRLFRGTLKTNSFIATLQLVYTMCHIAKEYTTEQIQQLQWQDLLQYEEIKEYWQQVKDR